MSFMLFKLENVVFIIVLLICTCVSMPLAYFEVNQQFHIIFTLKLFKNFRCLKIVLVTLYIAIAAKLFSILNIIKSYK